MPSLQSRLINLLLRVLNAKKMFAGFHDVRDDPQQFLEAVQKERERGNFQHEPSEKLKGSYPYEQIDLPNSTLHLHKVGARKKVILFLHGGAYVLGISTFYWQMVEKIGKAVDCHVAMLDYPLAPENTCLKMLAEVEAAFMHLLASYHSDEIIIMGDSAGGGLAMALGMLLRDKKQPQPDAIVLLYPWLDVTLSHPEARAIEGQDLVLGVDGLRVCGRAYAGTLGVEHPYVSPWFGALDGLPAVHVYTGTRDILHPEGRDFAHKLKAAGISVELNIFDEMQHAWLLFGMPESKRAIEQMASTLN